MVGSRTITALVGLLVGLILSVALTYYLGNVFVLFLFLPFIPLLLKFGRRTNRTSDRAASPTGWGRGTLRTCPHCGFQPDDRDYWYCPRDGTRLES